MNSSTEREFAEQLNPLVEPRELSYSTADIERQIFYGPGRTTSEGYASSSNYLGSLVQSVLSTGNGVDITPQPGVPQPVYVVPGSGLLRLADT